MIRNNAKIIAFVGLSGTGKSEASNYVAASGIPKVSFKTIIVSELKNKGLDQTPENEKSIREKLRLDPSGDIIAQRAILEITRIIDAGQRRIVIDGLGSWDTYKVLKTEFPGDLIVIALTSSRHIRHQRLSKRINYPLNDHQANSHDYDDIETLNKGGIIAIADYFIAVNGSIEHLHVNIDELLREIEF